MDEKWKILPVESFDFVMICSFYYNILWWIGSMHMNPVFQKLSKKYLKWMNNGWLKLAIQKKFRKQNIDFHSFIKKLEQFELGSRMALHHLIQLLFPKCWKHLATKLLINFHMKIAQNYFGTSYHVGQLIKILITNS